MKALFLDAHEPSASADYGIAGLAGLCLELGIDVVRYPNDQWKTYDSVEIFAENFKQEIRDATLLLSLGSFHWLKFFGNELGVNELIKHEVHSGKPFIIQSVRGYEKYFSKYGTQPGSEPIQSLFRILGVSPTPLKVFTNDAGSNVGGGAVAFFRAGDNCFLSADVLGDSDAILLSQPNILAFDRGVFPVVETGPLHKLVDEGDWHASLGVGLRPAVFVEVKTDKIKGFVIGGRFLGDGYEAVRGFVPGIENNLNAVRALLKKATGWRATAQSFESTLYQDLYDFERGLGDILIARLPAHETALLRDAELREIIEKVRDNWSKVADLFDYADAATFSRATSAIPAGPRRYLGHPIRLSFEPEALSGAATEQLSNAAPLVRAARSRLEKAD